MNAEEKVSIILATYNEAMSIEQMILSIKNNIKQNHEIIIVDDGSQDKTINIIEKLNLENIKIIKRSCKGLASAFNRGIIESSGNIICWMDADMSMPSTTLNELIMALKDFDIAIGSRYVDNGVDKRDFYRKIPSKLINCFANFILGGNIKDYCSGFVALKREVFNHVTLKPYGHGEYFIEFIFDSYQMGLKIKEIGFSFSERVAGKSKTFSSFFSFLFLGIQYCTRIIKIKLCYYKKLIL